MGFEIDHQVTANYQGQGSSTASVQKTIAPAEHTQKTEATVSQPQNANLEKTGEDAKGREKASSGQASNQAIKDAVEKINKSVQNEEAVFGIHDATNRVTIKIVDKKTKEVIKEFPPEKTLDMIAKVWEMAGIMVDEKR